MLTVKDSLLNVAITIDALKTKARLYFQDTKIPLEERWATFEKVGAYFCKQEKYLIDLDHVPEEYMQIDMSPFFFLKYQNILMVEIVEKYAERIDQDNDIINDLKEEILQKYIWSFIYDW